MGHWAASSASYLELGSTATATGGGKPSIARTTEPKGIVSQSCKHSGMSLDMIKILLVDFENKTLFFVWSHKYTYIQYNDLISCSAGPIIGY